MATCSEVKRFKHVVSCKKECLETLSSITENSFQVFVTQLVTFHQNSCFYFYAGQNVLLETSWTIWGTMTSWCCVYLKEDTSSAPTWWTGSRLSAATPVAQSPWRFISSVWRATWWVSAHSYTEHSRRCDLVWTERRSSCLRLWQVPWSSQKTCVW